MRYSSTTLVLLLLAGCSSSDAGKRDPASAAPSAKNQQHDRDTKSVEPDDAQAVEALHSLTADLKRDGDGFIVEAKLSGDAIDDRALAQLAGLRRLRSVVLTDTAVSDAGLATLGGLAALQALDVRLSLIHI